MNPTDDRMLNAMTVDVEDYFQVSAFEGVVDRATWDERTPRVERNTRALMALFDAHGVKATFFTLGWVADRFPALLRDLRDAGHEIASHGYEHRLVSSMDAATFRDDLRRAADAIHTACGVEVEGFRAPSFSITPQTLWAFDVLRDEGYTFSSSVFPVRHDRYGIPQFPRAPVRLCDDDGRCLWEFPMTTWRLLRRNWPVAGGGWMRVLPPAVMRHAIRRANKDGTPAITYLHPWEVDPDQPRIEAAGRTAKLRHYVNLDKMHGRLEGLLASFRFGTVSEVLARLDEGEPVRPAQLEELVTAR